MYCRSFSSTPLRQQCLAHRTLPKSTARAEVDGEPQGVEDECGDRRHSTHRHVSRRILPNRVAGPEPWRGSSRKLDAVAEKWLYEPHPEPGDGRHAIDDQLHNSQRARQEALALRYPGSRKHDHPSEKDTGAHLLEDASDAQEPWKDHAI